VLRLLQAMTSGTNTAMLTLAVAILPPHRLGMGMGMLQSGQFLGNSLGPALGGVAASIFGLRGSFIACGVASLLSLVLVAVLVREPPRKPTPASGTRGMWRDLWLVARRRRYRNPILAILAFQSAYAIGMTLMPLHIAQLAHADLQGATASAGLVLTANALGAAAGATTLGALAGRLGNRRLALASLVAAALLSVPQTFASDPSHVAGLRLFVGFAMGGVLPALRAVVGETHEGQGAGDPEGIPVGAVYGLAQSAFSGGMVFGPPLGSLAASLFGLPSIHVVSAAVLLATAALFGWSQRRVLRTER
jgi:MFS family permease